MKRHLGGIAIVDGTDHEFLWPDEYGHQETAIDMPLETGQGPVAVRVPHLTFGGEGGGMVLVSGAPKLYEGASERTTDLDDESGWCSRSRRAACRPSSGCRW